MRVSLEPELERPKAKSKPMITATDYGTIAGSKL
jgi:hypothetical protein